MLFGSRIRFRRKTVIVCSDKRGLLFGLRDFPVPENHDCGRTGEKLNDAKKAVYLLDGDNIRHGINSDLEFTDKDRDENIRRIGEISALFCDAGVITLAAFISPFRKMRRFARGRVGENQFLEVYVSTDFETCCKRDPKGLYKKNIKNFTGKDSGYEKPENPEIVLDTIHFTPQECAKVVYQEVLKRIN